MIGKRLQELRKNRNLTQEDLSEKLGISRSSLSLYEIDKREPDGETLVRIADYFDISLDYLFERISINKFGILEPQNTIDQFNTLSENELDMLNIFRRLSNERDQIKLLGRLDEIVDQMTDKAKSNDAQSTHLKKDVG